MIRWLAFGLFAGCAPAAPSTPSSPAAPDPTSARAPIVDASVEPVATDAGTDAPPVAERVGFPPSPIAPPSPRSAKPGDGEWVALGDGAKSEQAAIEPRLMFKTVVRPHPVSHWKSVVAVAIDLSRASLELVEGTAEPESKDIPKSERRGLVPVEDQPALLATFNGGWQAKHGRWGMMLDKKVFVPARPEGCTIAIYRDGAVRIGAWPALSSTEAEMRAYRQTPPCLVENGAMHPRLAENKDADWGGHAPGITTRHRSAIAIDSTGRILYYAIGEETTPKELAQGLIAIGAAGAAELDINFGWVKFLIFGHPTPDAPLQVTTSLFPKMLYRKLGYVGKSEPRDFFYVKRKQPGG